MRCSRYQQASNPADTTDNAAIAWLAVSFLPFTALECPALHAMFEAARNVPRTQARRWPAPCPHVEGLREPARRPVLGHRRGWRHARLRQHEEVQEVCPVHQWANKSTASVYEPHRNVLAPAKMPALRAIASVDQMQRGSTAGWTCLWSSCYSVSPRRWATARS